MERALEILGYVVDVAFLTLAVACLVGWRRHRTRGAGWVAASFSVLALISVLNLVIPEGPGTAQDIARKAGLALVLLCPYFLYRFTASFRRPPRWLEAAAFSMTALVVVWALLVPLSGGRSDSSRLGGLIAAVLVQWSFLSGVSVVRLWRAGRTEPTPVRSRLQLLGVALLSLNLLLVVAAAVPSSGPASGATVAVRLLALFSVLLFFAALFPPPALRRTLRGPEEAQFREAIEALVTATRPEEVFERLLQRIGIVGGRDASVVDANGSVLAHVGEPSPETVPRGSGAPDKIRLPLRSGFLLVRPSPLTPQFGRDEVGLLEALVTLAGQALDRIDVDRTVRDQARLLDLAPDAILARRLDGRIDYWNGGAEALYGYTREEAVGQVTHELLLTQFPLPRGEIEEILLREGRWEGQLVQTCRDGSRVTVASRWAARTDAEGRFVQVLVINTDITARLEAEREVQQARDEAERASQAKSEFLSRMSHELRTPLNAILGFGQLLEMEDLTPQQRDNTEEIVKAGRHLLDLINEVLEISRIEAGKLDVSIEAVPVHELVAESLSLIRPLADQRGLTLGYEHLGCEGRHVRADFQRLKQVLLNLLSNAVKYNLEGGSVHVGCEPAGPDRMRIRVTDTGPGVPPDRLEELFEPFERLGSEQMEIEGTGLGLALAKRLTEAMGGRIGVDSVLLEGSTFWIELDRAEDPLERSDVEFDEVGSLDERPRRPMAMLYIEDNLSNLKLVQRIIAARPEIKLIPAMHGRMGLDLARQHRPDVVLLDLQLPDMSGKEILRALKSENVTSEIPVVVISADATRGQVRELLSAGAETYLTKPLDVQRFLEVIDAVGGATLPA